MIKIRHILSSVLSSLPFTSYVFTSSLFLTQLHGWWIHWGMQMSPCVQRLSWKLKKKSPVMRIAYCFALHKWRCHVFLKDKMPDERQNSFHLSYFAAELLSDLWLNLSQKMIRKGRGLINHVEFSICKRGSWVTDPSACRAPPEAIHVACSITVMYR